MTNFALLVLLVALLLPGCSSASPPSIEIEHEIGPVETYIEPAPHLVFDDPTQAKRALELGVRLIEDRWQRSGVFVVPRATPANTVELLAQVRPVAVRSAARCLDDQSTLYILVIELAMRGDVAVLRCVVSRVIPTDPPQQRIGGTGYIVDFVRENDSWSVSVWTETSATSGAEDVEEARECRTSKEMPVSNRGSLTTRCTGPPRATPCIPTC